jgi:hypothetical protein
MIANIGQMVCINPIASIFMFGFHQMWLYQAFWAVRRNMLEATQISRAMLKYPLALSWAIKSF